VLLYWAWTADGPPSRGARLAGLAVPLALCLAGAAWRNTRIAGTFVPTPTISSGLLLHLGNNPNADGSYGPPDGFDGTILQQNMVAKRLAEQAVGRPLDAVAVDRHWLRVAAGYLAAHPARALELLGRKLLGYVDPRELILDLGFGLERARLPVLRVMLLPFPALLLLGTIGWLADRRDPRRRATRDAIAATALPSLVVCLVFFAQSRYRMSALAPALVFAPRGLEALRAWAAAGARGRLGAAAAAAAVVVAAVALARQRDTPREEAVARYNEAFAWERRRDAARARASFEAAFALAPDQPALRTDYARTLLQSGDVARAEAVLREGLATQPRAGVLLVMLGWVLYQQGRTGEAEAQFRTALAHEPANVAAKLSLAIAVRDRATDPPTLRQVAVVFAEVAATNDLKYARPALLGLGMTYARLGDAEQAEAAFRRMAHGQAPNALEESEWGFALYQLGRYAEARPHCRRAVELEPRNPIAHYRCALVEEQLGDAAAARAHLAQARALGLAVGGP
jgi:tetratricopeptide (TPR) repeat protein